MSEPAGGRPPKQSDTELVRILATYEHNLAAAEELAADGRVAYDDTWAISRRFESLVEEGTVQRRSLSNATIFYIHGRR